jgi:hypothetical protein
MTKKEVADKNIGMTFDFIKQTIDHPAIVAKIRDGAELDFIDKDMPLKKPAAGRKKKTMAYKVVHTFEAI